MRVRTWDWVRIMTDVKKKKIAILYSGGRYFGGIEIYLLNLFDRIDKNKFDIKLLSLGRWQLTEQMKRGGHKVVIFDKRRINFGTISEIGYYLKTNSFDLLVTQGTVANAYGRAVSLIYGIPNLVTVHSDQTSDYSNIFVRGIYSIIEKTTRFPTKKYICVSKYLKKRLIKNGVPAKKIEVVYNGLDFPKPSVRPHKRLVIGSIGRLHHVKGYDLLINAFAIMKNKRLRLKIAGSGDELGNLKQLALDLGVSDRVEFAGFKDDIYEFLDTIDVYVQTSRSEGFGLSVVEAMSQSLPVVVTPAGSLEEIITPGKTGFVSKGFSPEAIAEALSAAVDNYELSKKIGEQAKQYVTERFDIMSWVKDTEKIYEETCR